MWVDFVNLHFNELLWSATFFYININNLINFPRLHLLAQVEKEAEVTKEVAEVQLSTDNKVATENVKNDQWSPINMEGKKQYNREFLLQLRFSKESLKKPDGLPKLPGVILDKVIILCNSLNILCFMPLIWTSSSSWQSLFQKLDRVKFLAMIVRAFEFKWENGYW